MAGGLVFKVEGERDTPQNPTWRPMGLSNYL